jgi:hypothetical protein
MDVFMRLAIGLKEWRGSFGWLTPEPHIEMNSRIDSAFYLP